MNTSVAIKRMSNVDMIIGDLVPTTGEMIMDTTSNKLKIGDGKTAIKDLPWVDIGLDSAAEESSLSIGARAFLEDHIELIENNDYDTLYSRIATPSLAQEVTRALLKAGLNPKPYLTNIPNSIRHILESDKVWTEDTSRLYVDPAQADMRVFDEWNKKLFKQMGIPQNMIKVGN